MGKDSSYVTLSVLTSQVELAKTLIDDYYESEATLNNGLLTYFTYPEVGYGELDFLAALQAAGIAYLSEWESGQEYGAGCTSCRFTAEGGVVIKSFDDTEINPELGQLMELIDQPEQLRAHILDHKKSITLLPWDNQEEYGKLYQATQLITT